MLMYLADILELQEPRRSKSLKSRSSPACEIQRYPQIRRTGRRLEELKERHEQGLIVNIAFIKQLLEIAREVVQAEKEVEPDRGTG